MADCTVQQDTKVCSKCRSEKPATREFFSPLKAGKYELHCWCKACMAADRADRRLADPEKNRDAKKRSRLRHRDKALEKCRAYYAENKERLKAQMRAWHAANAARRSEQKKAARLANPEASREQQREWLRRNADHAKAKRKLWWPSYYAIPSRRLRLRMGAAIRQALRSKAATKKHGWQEAVGYTVDDLKRHLERQFVRGMSWDNYGTDWHIDHIVPVKDFSFSSTDDPEFKACWALTNLRPLWATDNLTKGGKRLHLL